jgi:hypothetical protein
MYDGNDSTRNSAILTFEAVTPRHQIAKPMIFRAIQTAIVADKKCAWTICEDEGPPESFRVPEDSDPVQFIADEFINVRHPNFTVSLLKSEVRPPVEALAVNAIKGVSAPAGNGLESLNDVPLPSLD